MDMTDDIRQWRKARRGELLARRVAVPSTQHRQWNEAMTQRLLEGFPLLKGMTIGFYWPINGEFDPRFAIRVLRESGATAALPVVVQKAAPLQFRAWWPGAPVTRGVYDLPVPDGTPVVVPDALLIPPVGFDAQGYRLGYGGGYFDRTLAAMTPQPLKIAVAFELSRMPTIRPQPYDVPMDFIVTEAGIQQVTGTGLEPVDDPSQVAQRAEAIVRNRRAAAPHDNSADGGATRGAHGGLGFRRYASSPFYGCQSDDDGA